MRTSAKVFMMLLVLVITGDANAESPREQLQQMVEQLRGNPADQALRERIIKLAQELTPAPAIPEEAREPFVMGTTMLKKASDLAVASKAAELFTRAVNIAPWFADAYYNRAIARQNAGQFESAMDDLKLYLEFNLSDAERREAQDKIYSIKAEAQLAADNKKADEGKLAQPTGDQRFLASLDGAIFDCGWFGGSYGKPRRHNWYEFKGGQLQYWAQYESSSTPQRDGPPDLIKSKMTRFARRADERFALTIILDQDKLTWIPHEGPFNGESSVCHRR